MEIEMEEWKDWADCARRELEHELEHLREEKEKVDNYLMAIEVARRLTSENEKQAAEIETLRQQLQEEKRLRAEQEVKLTEVSKLSVGMAKKASEEDIIKVLRTYANRSKRKTPDKRTFAKSAILEIAIAISPFAFVDSIHLDGDIVKALSPASFLNPSNSRGLKQGLNSCSQIPRNSIVLRLRIQFAIRICCLMLQVQRY
ncbi:MAG: hypothetical protein IJ826_05535 [Bacteroidaceae bacterium]|nr:hypothetical protein [Bacteroidaceae bacterium]